ncbi:FMN-binding protein [Streptococcus gallolyticus]|uniref:FMN-binding protein n=1 Tax=Streptococcus hepaticus TaxID=3349163 RepID=UPI001C96112E|nr:FMN-binding protein [Streptococcus gallolyticus]MBY5042066.1 FMN-binding protein [Streptococcus gallolyticus]
MKMKKVFAGLVLFSATLALVACGNSASKTESSASSEAKTEKVETTDIKWQDGTYTGESAFDDKGYKVVHSITIENGKITASNFNYEDKDGKLKADNEEYNKMMKEKSGVSSKEATEQLNKQLVDTQDAASVEVVSGATHTSENFVKATEALLAAAAEGKTDKVMFDFSK